VADTANRVAFGLCCGWSLDNASASISIAGMGNFAFTSGTRTFVNNTDSSVGFSRAGLGGSDLFDGPTDAAFATWDLLTSIGPISGTGSLMQWTLSPVTTNAGTLVFGNEDSGTIFTATLGGAAVPEPGSWLLITLGLAGLGLFKRASGQAGGTGNKNHEAS